MALNKRADLFDGVARAARVKYASKVGEMTSSSMVVFATASSSNDQNAWEPKVVAKKVTLPHGQDGGRVCAPASENVSARKDGSVRLGMQFRAEGLFQLPDDEGHAVDLFVIEANHRAVDELLCDVPGSEAYVFEGGESALRLSDGVVVSANGAPCLESAAIFDFS